MSDKASASFFPTLSKSAEFIRRTHNRTLLRLARIRAPSETPSLNSKETHIRKLKIIEHISLNGRIQISADDAGIFPGGDWIAPNRHH
jgi:hypothetical protein